MTSREIYAHRFVGRSMKLGQYAKRLNKSRFFFYINTPSYVCIYLPVLFPFQFHHVQVNNNTNDLHLHCMEALCCKNYIIFWYTSPIIHIRDINKIYMLFMYLTIYKMFECQKIPKCQQNDTSA